MMTGMTKEDWSMRPLRRVALCPKRAFVLIVEDEKEQLEELALALEMAGVPVMCANNGPAALDLLAQYEELCIVILGWRMSGMSGENLIDPLRKCHHHTPHSQ